MKEFFIGSFMLSRLMKYRKAQIIGIPRDVTQVGLHGISSDLV